MDMYCKKCDNKVEVTRFTIKIVKGEVINPETICNCGEVMKDVTEYNGLGGIIKRPGGRIRGKR